MMAIPPANLLSRSRSLLRSSSDLDSSFNSDWISMTLGISWGLEKSARTKEVDLFPTMTFLARPKLDTFNLSGELMIRLFVNAAMS